jgi:hypothetical protein
VKGVWIEKADGAPAEWRVIIPAGNARLVFRLGASGTQLDVTRTPREALRVPSEQFVAALHEAGLWFKELGERRNGKAATHHDDGDGND